MTKHISENYSDITPMLNQEVLGFVEVRGVRFILMGAIKDNAHLRTSNEVGWLYPVTRLALLEDIVEEARR